MTKRFVATSTILQTGNSVLLPIGTVGLVETATNLFTQP